MESKHVKFIFDKMPATDKASMLDFLNNKLKDEKSVRVAPSRVRDFYNPTLAENEKHKADYSKFVLSLFLVYMGS
jgi:hypothetical protein